MRAEPGTGVVLSPGVKELGFITAFLLLATGACSRGKSGQTAEDQLLLKAVEAIGAESASAGFSSELCQLSQEHLDYMIAQKEISHDNFQSRSGSIQTRGAKKTGEIVASNCGLASAEGAAKQCAASWEDSPKHRELMRQTWGTACYQMKLGEGGCYFCIGFFANGL